MLIKPGVQQSFVSNCVYGRHDHVRRGHFVRFDFDLRYFVQPRRPFAGFKYDLIVNNGHLTLHACVRQRHTSERTYEFAQITAKLELAVAAKRPEDGQNERLAHILLENFFGELKVVLTVVDKYVTNTLVQHGEHGAERS